MHQTLIYSAVPAKYASKHVFGTVPALFGEIQRRDIFRWRGLRLYAVNQNFERTESSAGEDSVARYCHIGGFVVRPIKASTAPSGQQQSQCSQKEICSQLIKVDGSVQTESALASLFYAERRGLLVESIWW